MKKSISFILAVCMGTALAVPLAACGETPVLEHQHSFSEEWTTDGVYHWHTCEDETCTEKEGSAEHTIEEGVCTVCGYEAVAAHTHTFETEWSNNATYHWHACEDETCSEKSQRERHDFDGNTCEVCGYEKPATPPSNWASYFAFDNVTAQKTMSTYYPEYDMTVTESESIKVVEDEWLWETTDFYYNNQTYQTFAVYYDGTNAYANGLVDNDMDLYKDSFFFDLDFSTKASSFSETSAGVFTAPQLQLYGINYTNVTITISNEKISSISYTMVYASSDISFSERATFTFTNWGTTQIDGSNYTQPSAWSGYFTFENVTVTQTNYAIVDGSVHQLVSDAVWKVNGEAWSFVRDMSESEGIVLLTNYYYYDGTNAYLNGESIDYSTIEYLHLTGSEGVGFLQGYEGSFESSVNGNQTVYTAESITYYNVITYTDLEITVVDGKITKIEFVQQEGFQGLDGAKHPLHYTYLLTDYGTTTVTDPNPTV